MVEFEKGFAELYTSCTLSSGIDPNFVLQKITSLRARFRSRKILKLLIILQFLNLSNRRHSWKIKVLPLIIWLLNKGHLFLESFSYFIHVFKSSVSLLFGFWGQHIQPVFLLAEVNLTEHYSSAWWNKHYSICGNHSVPFLCRFLMQLTIIVLDFYCMKAEILTVEKGYCLVRHGFGKENLATAGRKTDR